MLVTYPTRQPMGEGARGGRNKTPSPSPQTPQAGLPMPTRSHSAFVPWLSIIFVIIIINYKWTHFSDWLLAIVYVDLNDTFRWHFEKDIWKITFLITLVFLDSLVPESRLKKAHDPQSRKLRTWTQSFFFFFFFWSKYFPVLCAEDN